MSLFSFANISVIINLIDLTDYQTRFYNFTMLYPCRLFQLLEKVKFFQFAVYFTFVLICATILSIPVLLLSFDTYQGSIDLIRKYDIINAYCL